MGTKKGLTKAIIDLLGGRTPETDSDQLQPIVALFWDNSKSYLSKANEMIDILQKLELEGFDEIIKKRTLYTSTLSSQVEDINECSIENHCTVLLAKYSINLNQEDFERLVATIENAHIVKCLGLPIFGEPNEVTLLREILVKIENVEQIRQIGFVVSLTADEIGKVTTVSFGSPQYKFTLPLDDGIQQALTERHNLFSFCVNYLIDFTGTTEKEVRAKLHTLVTDHALEIKNSKKINQTLIKEAYLLLKESTRANVTTRSLLVYELFLKCYNWPTKQQYKEDNKLLDSDPPLYEKHVYDKIRYYIK